MTHLPDHSALVAVGDLEPRHFSPPGEMDGKGLHDGALSLCLTHCRVVQPGKLDLTKPVRLSLANEPDEPLPERV